MQLTEREEDIRRAVLNVLRASGTTSEQIVIDRVQLNVAASSKEVEGVLLKMNRLGDIFAHSHYSNNRTYWGLA